MLERTIWEVFPALRAGFQIHVAKPLDLREPLLSNIGLIG
jgi:hypothetical protein